MKTKTISLFALSILSLVMIVGMVSADTIAQWDFDSEDLNVDVGTGTLSISDDRTATYPAGNAPSAIAAMSTTGWDFANRYIELDLSTVAYQDIMIKFDSQASATGPIAFKLQYSSDGTIFTDLSGSTTSTVDTFTANPMHTFNFSSITAINNNANTEFRIVVPTAADGASGTFRIDNLLIEGSTYVAPVEQEPEDITEDHEECLIENFNDDLQIEIDDINVIGLGDEDKWAPLDEIEVEINVENKNNDYKIRDIEVKWGLYDSANDDWYIDDEESNFKLKDGEDKTIIVNFKLDEDIDDFEDGNYVFYVWTNDAYLDNTDTDVETDVCASDSAEIDFYLEDFLTLDNIQLPETVACGSDFQLTADIWNIGDNDQEDVWVLIKNQELGISEKVTIGDVDSFDSANLNVLLEIPKDAEESPAYLLTIYVYDEDDELFEAEFDHDEDSKFDVNLKVEGSCIGAEDVALTAALQSGGKAGEQMIIKATVTNLGDASATYVIKTSGFGDWAVSDDTQVPVVVGAGESKDVLITLNVNADASGSKLFNIEVLSGTDTLVTQPVTVTVEEKAGLGFGGLDLGSNKYLWVIGALNLLLVIIIIIVAIKVAAR